MAVAVSQIIAALSDESSSRTETLDKSAIRLRLDSDEQQGCTIRLATRRIRGFDRLPIAFDRRGGIR